MSVTEPIYIVGASMTFFGKQPAESVKSLTARAVHDALADAGLSAADIQAAWFANTRQPILEGQNSIRGQIALRSIGIGGIPVVNVENACASGSTAILQAMTWLRAGAGDIALAVGAEKMFFPDRPEKIAAAFLGGTDIYELEATRALAREMGARIDDRSTGERSIFMDLYAAMASVHMREFGTTQEDLARIAAKNHFASQYNDKAQYRQPMSMEEVLADRLITFPLTRAMCAPVSDGAAAAVLCTGRALERLANGRERAVRIRGCALRSGIDHSYTDHANRIGRLTALQAYEEAAVDPADVDVAEVHDATSFGEVQQIENLSLAELGGVPALLRKGHFALGGKTPVNPSGGLVSKGHPVAATGIAQLYELCLHLRGEAGRRQVEGARIAVAENGGGFLRGEEGACVVTVLEGPGRSR